VSDYSTLWAVATAYVLDDFTGELPITKVAVAVDVQDGTTWRALDHVAVATPLGMYTFPKLEKVGVATGLPARTYRLRVSAPGYTPYYVFNSDGVQISVYPYDDDDPPATLPTLPTIIALYPASDYPFGNEVPLLRGTVVDSTSKPVANALVECLTDRVLTDSTGVFALPMRKSPAGQALVDASDSTGRTGTTAVTVPQGLGQRQTITIA
jgi:hypothetical protein